MSVKQDVQGFDISRFGAVIVGCGGLGTNAAVHLAGAGIGRLKLCDFDVVEERNLNRQFFYTAADAGKKKCELLSQRIKAYAPECEIETFREKIGEDFSPAGYDVVIAAVDNIETRRKLNEACRREGVPLVTGAIDGFFGTAYLFVPGMTADIEAAGCLEKAAKKQTSPSAAAGVIGALEAKLATDYFLNDESSFGRLYIFDNNEIQSMKIRSGELD